MEYELCIREAEVQDAADLIAFLNTVNSKVDEPVSKLLVQVSS